MRKDLGGNQETLVFHLNIFSRHCDVGDSHPLADGVPPANNATVEVSVSIYYSPRHNSAVFEAGSSSYLAPGSDYHIGTKLGRRIDFGSWVDPYLALYSISCDLQRSLKGHGIMLRLILKEHFLSREVVLGLSDVHPVPF
jgi:hypothetical protein